MEKPTVFPAVRDGDILSVVLNSNPVPALFVVSGVDTSDRTIIHGVFGSEYGNSSPRALYPRDVISIKKVVDTSCLLEDLIRDRNSLRKKLAKIEKNIANLLELSGARKPRFNLLN